MIRKFFVGVLLLYGSVYRYVRIIPGLYWTQPLPFALTGLASLYAFMTLVFTNPVLNQLDKLVITYFLMLTISTMKVVLTLPQADQLQYIAIHVTPVGVYFLGRHGKISFSDISLFFKFVLVIAAAEGFVEWYMTNFVGVPLMLLFGDYWDAVGVEGYHSSGVYYYGLGLLTRPWGILANPQSSGSLLAVLGLYFTLQKGWGKYLFLAIALFGVYVSGSRTAIVTLFAGWAIIIMLQMRSSIKIVVLVFYLALAALVFFEITVFYDPAREGDVFIQSIFDFVEYILFPDSWTHFFSILFGQGMETGNYHLLGSGDIHLFNDTLTIGLVPSFIFLLIIALVLRVGYRLERMKVYGRNDVAALMVVVAGMVIGSLHYDVLNRFPVPIIIWTCIGMLSRGGFQHLQKKKPVSNCGTPPETVR